MTTNLDDLLGELDNAEQTAQKKKKSRPADRRFDSPLADMPTKQAAKATQAKSLAGQYKRRTITLPLEQDDYIGEIAKQENMGKLAMYRWLLDCALSHYEEGQRPEKEVVSKATPKLRHWSSSSD